MFGTLSRPSTRPLRRIGIVGAGAALLGMVAALPALAADPPPIYSGDGLGSIGTLSTKTIFAYGTLGAGDVFTLSPGTVPGFVVGIDSKPGTYDLGLQSFSVGGTPNSYVWNVDKVDSYDAPFQYSDPIPGSNWISAYIDKGTDPAPAGDHTYFNEPGRLGNLMPDVFAYITTFTVDPSLTTFPISGTLLSDDSILSAYVDYGFTKDGFGNITGGSTAGSTAVTIGQDATDTFTYSTQGTFGTVAPITLAPGQHTLTFFVANNNNDRTALDFVSPVPEPGAVTAGVTMVSSLLGLMGAARIRRRRTVV